MDNENGVVTKNNTTNSEGTKSDEIVAQQKNLGTCPSELFLDSVSGDPLVESKGALEVSDNNNPKMSVQESSTTAQSAGGYDPNRIPSAIFTGKPASPMEWSLASNESLFSIHMGNNSFTRDHVYMLYKSGELPKPDEMNNSPPNMFPVMETRKSGDLKMTEEKLTEPAKTETQLPGKEVSGTSKKKAPSAEDVRNSSSSTQSFQFPVLEANVGGSASVKVVMDKQPSQQRQQQQQEEAQPQAPGTPPKPAGNSWFSCFSCCSLGC
ncbi:hypothetical protein JCGZ_19945 [Jatropha curcas]|uniref:Uncharacterized protein n=1 Tax=Jatropha curcas TaxID=180498 RepID=A0A067JTI0_JATCU|nr:uncharacterized protein LOC105644194 [Jatropha curcas]KDP27246.1 hypothetical protein JCGZ_19945 [Jatropha curcas]